jgi:type I restriction enzyme, S subunit
MTFASFKNARVVRSGWLNEGGRRLDCNPYMSGALEARDALKRLLTTERLANVTERIFHAGREGRTWVEDSRYGIPFLGSSDILSADLSRLPLISSKQVERNPLFKLGERWTLITRSGTIGRMAYVRPEMVGMACSEHVLRVVPDAERIPPGYLYAFLTSRYGVPLVVSGTYGAIIQHIEPEHISDLPVPRFEYEFENKIHQLIEKSADLRSAANITISDSLKELNMAAGFSSVNLPQVTQFSYSSVMFSGLNDRLDAPYHSAAAISAEKILDRSPLGVAALPSVVKRYFKPPIFKRLWVDSEEHGRLFVSGNDIYRYQAEEPRYVSRRTPKFDEFLLERGTVIFQAAGQIYGLFGRPLFVSGWLEGAFCADDVFRITPFTEVDGAFLYLFLRTEVGEALIKRQACGNSIPRVWEPHISKLKVLWPDQSVREIFARPVIEAHEMIEQARQAELKAIKLLEQRIIGE